MRTATVLAFLVLASAAPLAAQQARLAPQQDTTTPRRPQLPANGDTNSAQAYYNLGVQKLETDPRQAAAAFYWASRLNPESGDNHYARWVALHLGDPERWRRYNAGDWDLVHSPAVRAVDTLFFRAQMLDPFLYTRFDHLLELELVKQYINRDYAGMTANDLQFVVRYLVDRDPSAAATIDYGRGNFSNALEYWGRAAHRNPRNSTVRVWRAEVFYHIASYDSARVQMQEALGIVRRADADSLRFFYQSKALWELMLGRVLERLGDLAGARAAYERASIEDLSYFPAHIQLGMLHAARGDTTAAIREFNRAVESRENEFLPHSTLAFFLANSGKLDSAVIHLRRAIEIEPWVAGPRLNLGAILDALGDGPGALAAFEGYAARATRADPDLPTVRARIQQLRPAR